MRLKSYEKSIKNYFINLLELGLGEGMCAY